MKSKLGVGDEVKITGENEDGQVLTGVIIDYEVYPEGRVFLIQLSNGEEKEIPERKLKKKRQ